MAVSVSLHTKGNHSFNAEGYITSNQYTKDYVVFKIETREQEYGTLSDVTLFPSYEQAKEMHKALTKLMKEIAKQDKRTKAEIHANNLTNSKIQKFSQLVEQDKLEF